MSRCYELYNLKVYYKDRDGGNSVDNAVVLCESCYAATDAYNHPGHEPPPFSKETQEAAMHLAGWQCQCVRTGNCH